MTSESMFDDGVDDWYDVDDDPPDDIDRVLEVCSMMSIYAAQRLVRIAGMRVRAVADHQSSGRTTTTEIIDRSVRLELAAAMRVTEYAAGELLALADAVVFRYPVVLEALERADITERHADILVSTLDGVEPEHRDELLRGGLVMAKELPVGVFRRRVRALADTLRAATLAERHARALPDRRVFVEPADDNMSWFMALLPSVEAHAAYERLTAIAKTLATADGDTRTLDQLRADALGDLLIEGSAEVHPEASRGIRATVAVTVPVLALMSAESDAASRCEPPTVDGVGPIPLDAARELCGASDEWMRVLTHPETGMVISVGRDRYQPPPSLAKLVKWRAARCMAPGCSVPAARCQVDHTFDWQFGGTTALRNLSPLCQGHHTVKHHGGWTVRQVEGSGGTIEWISPSGRRYVVEPERPMPAFLATGEERAPF